VLTSIDIFRGSHKEDYPILEPITSLPVISVSSGWKPKLKNKNTEYVFGIEEQLMMGQMRTILRIASYFGHQSLTIGAFGLGHAAGHPVRKVASMWRRLLFEDEEFVGVFGEVLFAIDTDIKGLQKADAGVFMDELSVSKIFPTRYGTNDTSNAGSLVVRTDLDSEEGESESDWGGGKGDSRVDTKKGSKLMEE
jgi:hypothetical protein